MILHDETIRIKLDGVTFMTHEPDPSLSNTRNREPHFRLDEVAIDGWYDGVGVRRQKEARPVTDGDFRAPGRLASRTFSITGTAIANSPIQLQVMRDRLIGIGVDGNFQTIEVYTPSTGMRYAVVGLEDKTQWIRQTDKYATFKIELYAPEPEIYGETRKYTLPAVGVESGINYSLTYPLEYGTGPSQEVVSIENFGNTDAWPIFYVYGDLPSGFTISDGGRNRIVYTELVTMQNPVMIDFAKGTAIQNKISKTTFLTQRDWFPIKRFQSAPITPTLSFPSGNGYGWMEVWMRDTWI